MLGGVGGGRFGVIGERRGTKGPPVPSASFPALISVPSHSAARPRRGLPLHTPPPPSCRNGGDPRRGGAPLPGRSGAASWGRGPEAGPELAAVLNPPRTEAGPGSAWVLPQPGSARPVPAHRAERTVLGLY